VSRIEHYNDPAAPVANSIVPAVTVVVANDAGDEGLAAEALAAY
jgi:hypothetical protein